MSEPELQVGDLLAFRRSVYSVPNGRWNIVKIDRITPTGRIKVGAYTLNADLTVRGRSSAGSDQPHEAKLVTPQIREEHLRDCAVYKLTRVKFCELPDIVLYALVRVLTQGVD